MAIYIKKQFYVAVDDAYLLPQEETCRLCSGKNWQKSVWLQSNPTVFYRLCQQCGAGSVSRFPKQSFIDKLYHERGNFTSLYEEGMALIESERNTIRTGKHIFKQLKRHLSIASDHLTLLDFGGFNGKIAATVAAECLAKFGELKTVSITVVDYNTEALETPADPRIKIKAVADLDSLAGTFDIVLASAIMEHLPTPMHTANKLVDKMHSGSVIFLRTPYMLPFSQLLARFGVYFNLFYPVHLYDLGVQFWEGFYADAMKTKGLVLCASRPSLVQTLFREFPLQSVLAGCLKMPWYLLKWVGLQRYYHWVGSWEVIYHKR